MTLTTVLDFVTMFFAGMLGGWHRVRAGDQVLTANTHDLVIVSPNVTHAFATPATYSADFRIVLTPSLLASAISARLSASAVEKHSFRNCWPPRISTTTTSWTVPSSELSESRLTTMSKGRRCS